MVKFYRELFPTKYKEEEEKQKQKQKQKNKKKKKNSFGTMYRIFTTAGVSAVWRL